LHALSYDDDTSSSPSGKEGEEEEDDSDDDEKGGYYKTKHWNPTKHTSNGLSNDDSSSSDDSEHAELKMEKEGGVAQRRTPGALESIEGNVFRDRERLKSDKDFDRVKKTGRTLNYSCIRIKAAPNDGVPGATGCHRIGIVVPKKQLKRAVDRNLCKRRVRAIFRTNKDKWPKTESGSHLDFVVFVKQEALEGGFKQLEKEMFLFASDYTEREMKSKTSKSRNAAKVVRNTNANVTRTAQASNENENVRAKKENGPTNNIAR
jgi:ribonuclease P protein component